MTDTIGFIGLGVMGGPMCRNIATKHAGRVLCFDLSDDARAALSGTKAEQMDSVEALAAEADVICLSLPGGPQVLKVAEAIALAARAGTVVVDLSTTTVADAHKAQQLLGARGISFADAPVARTREAAQQGKLSIMVGAAPELFARISPVLDYMASDVTHGGDVGAGQVLKLVHPVCEAHFWCVLLYYVPARPSRFLFGHKAYIAVEINRIRTVSNGSEKKVFAFKSRVEKFERCVRMRRENDIIIDGCRTILEINANFVTERPDGLNRGI